MIYQDLAKHDKALVRIRQRQTTASPSNLVKLIRKIVGSLAAQMYSVWAHWQARQSPGFRPFSWLCRQISPDMSGRCPRASVLLHCVDGCKRRDNVRMLDSCGLVGELVGALFGCGQQSRSRLWLLRCSQHTFWQNSMDKPVSELGPRFAKEPSVKDYAIAEVRCGIPTRYCCAPWLTWPDH